jgi:nicotinamide-nucleotide amidase
VNKRQAYIPDGAEALMNSRGTAPGIWAEREGKTVILLPGPPHEMKPMFVEDVLPRLQEKQRTFTGRRIFKVAGLTESKIESLIYDLYPKTEDAVLTPLARPGQIEIHLFVRSRVSKEAAAAEIERLSARLRSRLGGAVISETGEDLEAVVGRLLLEQNLTLSVAESCTGGHLGSRITDVPGSSGYFLGGILSYSNRAKRDMLDVPEEFLLKHGAVSPETAEAMAKGVRARLGADYGLAITGIAGPEGGTPSKPVGLVYTALSGPSGTISMKNSFLGNRENIKFQSSQKALDMLRRHLLGLPAAGQADEVLE